MYSVIIHPLRKAYNLSVAEYCVLECIRNGQNMEKYDRWCVYSMEDIAESIGMSREWILSCYKKLEVKGLIRRRRTNSKDTAVRTTDEWNEWNSPMFEKYLMYLKLEHVKIETGDVKGLKQYLVKKVNKLESQEVEACEESSQELVNKVHITCEESSHNTNNTNKEINISSKEDRQSHGKEEINQMLTFLKQTFGLSDFRESQKEQRIVGNNLVSLARKFGKEKFRGGLTNLAKDSFKRKNCNSLWYIYKEMKSTPDGQPLIREQSSVLDLNQYAK